MWFNPDTYLCFLQEQELLAQIEKTLAANKEAREKQRTISKLEEKLQQATAGAEKSTSKQLKNLAYREGVVTFAQRCITGILGEEAARVQGDDSVSLEDARN